jgi:xanthine dehydrogenase small subunit
MTVRFVLNGKPVEVNGVDPHVTLLEWLRAEGFTGTKEGCAEGECGACAVALVRRDFEGRARFEPVNSCLVPLPAVDGQSVVTVEGVAAPSGELHPVQRAMVELGGSQCGYCTPGFVISLFCEYYRPGRTAFDPEAIGGNLCRCTGYRPILDVGRAMPPAEDGDPRYAELRCSQPAMARVDHEGEGRRFLRPTELAELSRLLTEYPDAVLIAGGTDLMVYANQRYDRWSTLISLEGIASLREFAVTETELVFGAGVPLAELEERLAAQHPGVAPALEELFPLFSSRLIRNRATLGGNLGTASPIGDSPPVLLMLDAEVVIQAAAGERRLPLTEFFPGYRKTALAPGEFIVRVHVPRPMPTIQRFYKVSKRRLDDISTAAAAFGLDLSPGGRVERLRIAYGGIAATPLRAFAAEKLALGKPWGRDAVALVSKELEGFGSPMTDHRGSEAYRRAVVVRLFEKFFIETTPEAEAAE